MFTATPAARQDLDLFTDSCFAFLLELLNSFLNFEKTREYESLTWISLRPWGRVSTCVPRPGYYLFNFSFKFNCYVCKIKVFCGVIFCCCCCFLHKAQPLRKAFLLKGNPNGEKEREQIGWECLAVQSSASLRLLVKFQTVQMENYPVCFLKIDLFVQLLKV